MKHLELYFMYSVRVFEIFKINIILLLIKELFLCRMTSVSLPTLVDDDFFLREPPPAYSVAVGEADVNVQNVPIIRPRRQRRQRLRHVPPPQVKHVIL